MKTLTTILLIVGVTVNCQASSGLSRLIQGRSRRDLSGDECKDQTNGALIPYPGDCTKYLVCQWFEGTIMNCPSGLHWNADEKICDWPTAAGCTEGTATPSQSTASTTPTVPTTTPSTLPPDTTTTVESSPSETTTEVFSTTPSATEVPTTPSTIETTTPTTIPITTPSTLPPDTTSSAQPTLGVDDEVCQGKEDGTLSAYPYDCAWYIRCEDDKPLVLPCEDGWLFNAILLICDYPEYVDCTTSPYPTPSETTTELPTTTPSPTTVPTTPSTIETTTPTTIPTTTPSTLPPDTTSSAQSTPTLGVDDDICQGKEDGTLSAYPYDCAWYIRCEDDKPLVLPCEDGWLFNAILLICDYPENVDCTASPYPIPSESTTELPVSTLSPATIPTTLPVTLPTPPTPSTAFPTTVPTTLSTSVTTPTEPTSTSSPTTLPGTLPTPPTPSTASPTTVPTTLSTSETTPTEPTSTSIPTTVDPTLPTPDDYICQNQPNNAVLPYPWDCAWYVRCENQKPVLTPCDDGWVYNSVFRICDFPANVECVTTPYPTTVSSPTTTMDTTLDWSSTTNDFNTEQPSTRPPYVGTGVCANQELGTKLPYPNRCSLYIVCEEPAPQSYNCDAGLEFNAELKICQDPEEAGCSIKKTTSTTTEATTTPVVDVPTGICEGLLIGDRIPYPGICSEYILCELPIPISQECPNGYEFNADLKLCESPEEAGCTTFNTTTTTAPETTPTPSPQPGFTGICRGQQAGDLIPYPGDCQKYIICENPIPIAQKCGADQDFNADLGICDDPDEGGCSNGNNSTTESTPTTTLSPETPGMVGICKGYQEGNLIPYPNKCSKYIRCETPVPIAQTCKAGLHFNEALGICDSAESAGCGGYTTTESPSGSTTTGPTTTPKPPVMTGICRDQEIGDKIPYPKNCSKFIICDVPVPIAIACESGLHFNAELQVCEDPTSAGCEEYPPVTTNVCCGQPSGTLLAYPEDCTQYIQCDYPIPKSFSCDADLHFNALTKKCESVHSAACEWHTTTEVTTTARTPLTCQTAPDGTRLPVEGDCKKYIQCMNGDSIPMLCPGNTIFNPEGETCVSGTTCPT